MEPRIVLVGFMGAGKSTVGPKVARRLGWTFRDMDACLEERAGLTIAETFRQRGEAHFRVEEARLAAEIGTTPELVVAAGGGAFSFPETRRLLQAGAFTVWLRCELPELLNRIRFDGSRPLAPDRETIIGLFAERETSYRLADWTVDASAIGPDEVARAVVEAFRGPRADGVGSARQR